MHRGHMREWIHSLEDGSFDQTNGVLCRTAEYPEAPAGYCCLGVWSSLVPYITRDEYKGTVFFGLDRAEFLAPQEAIEWMGLTDDDVYAANIRGIVMRDGRESRRRLRTVQEFQTWLTRLNDGKRESWTPVMGDRQFRIKPHSFKQIARRLRKWFDITD